jgi:cytohesin
MANRERLIVALVVLVGGLVVGGCSVQAPSTIPELTKALESSDIGKIGYILADNPKLVNSIDRSGIPMYKGRRPLHIAVAHGNKQIAELLIANGANVNAKTEEERYTPLHIAVDGSRMDIAEHGSYIDGSYLDVAKLLIVKGANVNAPSRRGKGSLGNGRTPLQIAAELGRKEFAELLIANGADVNLNARYDVTPLCIAARWEGDSGELNRELVELLIDSGAATNRTSKRGCTPLYHAVMGGQKDTVELLVAKGAKVKRESLLPCITSPPFQQSRFDWEIAEYLVAQGAEVNIRSGDGSTPLHTAATYGPANIVRLYLEKGADVNAKRDAYGWPKRMPGPTPLHAALGRLDKDIEVVELLIAKGADVNAKYYADRADGWPPLHSACSYGHTKAVELLIAKGAKVQTTTDSDRTPLHLAVITSHKDIVEILIAKGANLNVKDNAGNTPLAYAVHTMSANKEIADLLRKHGAKE